MLLQHSDDPSDSSPLLVTIKGLTRAGYLLAVDGRGRRFELSPDGNSFDFFQGLIGRKL